MRRPARFSLLVVVAALAALVVSAPARADTMTLGTVTQWNENASAVLISKGGQGASAVAHLAMVHGAVYDAVNSIERRHAPYLGWVPAKRWYSKDAAVAAAAYNVLIGSDPAVAPATALEGLELRYNESLATIPDGPAKQRGIATGTAAAEQMFNARRGDGRFGPFRFTPALPGGPPGAWQLTSPPANDPFAWLKDVKPFLIEDASDFASDGPNPLTSRLYTKEFDEVKAIGEKDSATRMPDQTAAVRFWGQGNAVGLWQSLLRGIAEAKHLPTADSARFFAMLELTAADALIATWEDKAKWSFWRPVTAIREAEFDGNPDTDPQAGWTSEIGAPSYPEHPSGLSALSGAYTNTLRQFFGTDRMAFEGTNSPPQPMPPAPPVPSVTRNYTRFSQALQDVVDARVWGGIHFRTADVQGAKIGKQVARFRSQQRFFRPVGHHGHHDHHDHHGDDD